MLQVLAQPAVVDLAADPSAAAPDTNNERKKVYKVPIGGRGDGGDGGDGGGDGDGRRRWKWRAGAPASYGKDEEEEEEEEEDADYDDEIPAEDSDGVPLRWTACTACMQV